MRMKDGTDPEALLMLWGGWGTRTMVFDVPCPPRRLHHGLLQVRRMPDGEGRGDAAWLHLLS